MSVPRPLHVLILEDHPADAELMLDELRQAGFEPDWSLVDNEADYLAQLDSAPEIVLADYRLPQWDAPSALRALQASGLDIPFIMLSGTVGEEQAVECIKLGAADYLLKDRLARLGSAVAKALEERRLRLENEQAQAAQRESAVRYRRLFEAARDGILILDAESGQIVDVNPFLVDLLGFSFQDLLEKKVWEIGLFKDVIASQDAFRRLVETGYARYEDLPLETKEGRVIAVEFVSNVYQAGGKTVIQCNIRDISARKQSEQAQRKSQALLAQMGRIAQIGAWELTPETMELAWSDEVYRIHEVDRDYHPTLSEAISFYAPTSRPIIEQAVQHAIERAEPFDLQLELMTAKGNHRWVHALGMPHGESGEARTVSGTFRDITAWKRAEDDLRFQAQLLNTVGQAVIATNLDNQVTYWNRFAETLYGWSAEEALGRKIVDLTPADTSQEQAAEIMARLQTGESWSGEFTVQNRTGTVFPALVTDTPIVDDNGAQLGVIGVSMDITERKQIEADLEQERRLLRTVIDNIPDFIYAKDREGRFLLRNTSWLSTMNVSSPDEVIGKTDFDYYPHDLAERYTEDDQQVIESGQPLINREETTLSPDGSTRWLLTTKVPLRDRLGSVIGLVGIGHDITKRKQIEAILREREQQLVSIFETVEDVIYYLTVEESGRFRFTSVNQAFLSTTGLPVDQVVGKTVNEVIPEPSLTFVLEKYKNAIQTGKPVTWEETSDYPTGRLTGEVSIAPIYASDGRCIHLVGTVHDITERKQAAEQLAKKNRALAVLSAVNQAIVRIRAPLDLFREVCRIAVEQGGFRMAWIGLFDPETTRVNPVASAGITEDYLEKLEIVLSDELLGYGPTGSAVRTGEHDINNDYEHHLRMAPWREAALRLGYRASAAFPLRVAGEMRGALTLYADQADFFDDEEIELLDEMAADISFAMAFAEQEEQRQQAETALEQHAQALEEMHLFLQTALDAFPAHTAVLDPDGTIINVNASWAKFGDENGSPSPLHWLGDNYLTLCDTAVGAWSDEAAPAAAGIRGVMDGTQAEFYLEYPCHSLSEQRWFTLRVTPFPEPAPRRVVVAHINVTQRRLAEDAIRALNADLERRVIERTSQFISAKERTEAILNSSSDPIILFRTDGAIDQANPASDALLGSRADDIFDRHLISLLMPLYADVAKQAFRAVLESGQSQRFDAVLQRNNGSSFDADVAFSPVIRQNGSLSGIVCTIHDITERLRMEDGLRKALATEKELGQLKTQFISIVSHEFRNPLASILSGADLMINYGDRMTDERKRQHLNAIQEQVQHLTGLMNDVLLIGKAENVGFEFAPAPLDLAAFCQAIVAQLQQTTGRSHTIRLSTEGECGAASADEKLLRHILTNLLSNALKYSPEGSIVTVELRCDPGQATLRVRDQGIGIPAEDQPRLFEAFHRATNVGLTPGTGLGLAITKRAVEAHRGTIDFESDASQGTTFIVTFPIR